jgi:hypothetical protein
LDGFDPALSALLLRLRNGSRPAPRKFTMR